MSFLLPSAHCPLPTALAVAWPFTLEYFSGLAALGLFAVLAAPFLLLGMRSLAGLGPVRKWVAIGLRLAVVGLIVLILGGIRWQRQHHDVEVMVVRDISQSTQLVTDYPRAKPEDSLQTAISRYLLDASSEKLKKPPKDRIGVISFHSDALIDSMPNERLELDTSAIRDAGSGTDVGAGLQLALATLRRDAMHRLLLIWDGNSTLGDIDPAIDAAAAAHIPIDVMPLRYNVTNEVMVDRFITPTWKREGEAFPIDVVMKSTNATDVPAKITVYHQNEPLDLDPYTQGVQASKTVTLHPGTNVERIKVPGQHAGAHQFKAVIEAENVSTSITGPTRGGIGPKQGDTLLQNNVATAFTFVQGKGQVLLIDNTRESQGQFLRNALLKEGIAIDTTRGSIDQFPTDIITLQNYDSIVLLNVPRGAGGMSEDQQKILAAYVHENGGGLVMVGGPDSFGAGGWQGSKLEEILPVNMDIPAQRQIAKGALVLIIHSCEIPDGSGNYWGTQCAIKAAETLSERDEIGVISFAWQGPMGGGAQWDYPLSEKGDGSKVIQAIKTMKLGDMMSFDDCVNVALNGKAGVGGLVKSDARQKHIIIISDGDPAKANQTLMDQCIKGKITISTITVTSHGVISNAMKSMADDTHGKFYGPITGNFNQLPQIFIKEATVVRRSLIHEVKEGIPLKRPASTSELVKGIGDLPPVFGMVLTSPKNNPQIEMPIVAGKNNDPVLAHWQTGLGKVAVFTSDAHNVWAANWVADPLYEKFWAQVVRGVSRPPMSSSFDIQATQSGDRGKVAIEALDKEASFLNFLNIHGQVVGPDLKAKDVRPVQTGPGLYEVPFDTPEPGNYLVSMRYTGPKGESGWLLSGVAVNTSPELRDLRSQDAVLERIAQRTGGRVLPPFDAARANLFDRAGLSQSASPMPVWDLLIPLLLALILADIAARRIAWDWLATRRMLAMATQKVRDFTMTTRKVESAATLESLKKVRDEVADQKFKAAAQGEAPPPLEAALARPDPKAKFEAKGVEGDITSVVGGATDKPVPPPPKKIEPKGLAATGAHTGSLLEAKRRAQQKIKEKERES